MSGVVKNIGGRPPRAPGNSDARLVARCTWDEHEAAEKAAEAVDETLSDFVRRVVAETVFAIAHLRDACRWRLR